MRAFLHTFLLATIFTSSLLAMDCKPAQPQQLIELLRMRELGFCGATSKIQNYFQQKRESLEREKTLQANQNIGAYLSGPGYRTLSLTLKKLLEKLEQSDFKNYFYIKSGALLVELENHPIIIKNLLKVQLSATVLSFRDDVYWSTTWAHLQGVSFFGCGLLKVPKWVSSLKDLTSLNLAFNENIELPDFLQLFFLKELYLHYCSFTHLPELVMQLRHLKMLYLAGNNFSNDTRTEIAQMGGDFGIAIDWGLVGSDGVLCRCLPRSCIIS